MDRILVLTSAGAVLAAMTVFANAEKFAEPSDSVRWYIAAHTPAGKNTMPVKEAGAALRKAWAECRAASERRACERAARENFRAGTAKARDNPAQP